MAAQQLLCVRRYSNGQASYQPGDYVEGLSEEAMAALEADSPGAFERVTVVRHVVAPGAEDLAILDVARADAEELRTWRKRWADILLVVEQAGETVAADSLPGYLRELLAGRGTLADKVRELAAANEAQATTIAAQGEQLAALAAKLEGFGAAPDAPKADEPAPPTPKTTTKATKAEKPVEPKEG